MDPNKRKYHRLSAQIDCEVQCAEGTITASVRDVSISGAFVCCEECPPIGTECQVFFADGSNNVGPVTAMISRIEAGGMALEFEDVPAEDCVQFLQDLLTAEETM